MGSWSRDAQKRRLVMWRCTYTLIVAARGARSRCARRRAGARPTGHEFQVNTYTTSNQVHPSVAVDADGDFVVVWRQHRLVRDGHEQLQHPGPALRLGRIGAGRAVPGQHLHDRATSGIPRWRWTPTGTSSWCGMSNGSSGTDTSSYSIQGQRYASNGAPQGAEFQVNTYTTSDQACPSVAMDAGRGLRRGVASDGSSGTDTSGSASRASATPRTDRRRARSSRSTPTARRPGQRIPGGWMPTGTSS